MFGSPVVPSAVSFPSRGGAVECGEARDNRVLLHPPAGS